MKRTLPAVVAVLLTPVAPAFVLAQAPAAPVKAVGSVELKDAAGDMDPITTSSGKEPPLDVVNLAIRSDGSRLTLAATLAGPPGAFATAPIRLYIDTDNNPATGIKGFAGRPGGFEYKADLAMCIKYSDKSEACAGGSTKAKPTERYAAVELDKFKGADEYSGSDTVLDAMGFPGKKAAVKVPVTGNVVSASIDYADLGVKPGQTIRLLAREAGGSPKDGDGSFPIVLLTLK
jgi:hypothetical protein